MFVESDTGRVHATRPLLLLLSLYAQDVKGWQVNHARSAGKSGLACRSSLVIQRKFFRGIDLTQTADLPYSVTDASHHQAHEQAQQGS